MKGPREAGPGARGHRWWSLPAALEVALSRGRSTLGKFMTSTWSGGPSPSPCKSAALFPCPPPFPRWRRPVTGSRRRAHRAPLPHTRALGEPRDGSLEFLGHGDATVVPAARAGGRPPLCGAEGLGDFSLPDDGRDRTLGHEGRWRPQNWTSPWRSRRGAGVLCKLGVHFLFEASGGGVPHSTRGPGHDSGGGPGARVRLAAGDHGLRRAAVLDEADEACLLAPG